MRVSWVPATPVGRRAYKVPQAEFSGRASPAWIRCRFFGNEGKYQLPEVLGNSESDPGEARGAAGIYGLAERVSAATLAKMIRQKETFLPALCTHIATHTAMRCIDSDAALFRAAN